MNKKLIKFSFIAIILLLVTCSMFFMSQNKTPVVLTKENLAEKLTILKSKIVVDSGDVEFARDLSNDSYLMGDSHNVFVGMVVDVAKTNGWDTFFTIQIIKNIKGSLMDSVLVHIPGGYRNGAIHIAEGLTWLEPGSTYLLATRSGGNYYELISFPTAWRLLSKNSNLTDSQLSNLAVNDSRVQQLEKAYTQEVPLPVDLAHNNARNSYQSLTEAQKAALPYYAPPPLSVVPVSSSTATSTGN